MPDASSVPASASYLIRKRASDVLLPVSVLWEITQRCHQRCGHCYLRGRYEENELTTEEAGELLHQMAELGVLFLVITGGEPLLRDDLFDIIDRAAPLGFAWKLMTSGSILGEKEADLIAERHPVNVDFTLMGLENTHDSVTGLKGSFRSTLKAIRALEKSGIHTLVKSVLTPEGLKDLPELRKLVLDCGSRLMTSPLMLPDLEGRPADADLQLNEAQLLGFYADAVETCGVERGLGVRRIPLPDEPMCNAARSSFAVSPSGDVRACLALRKVYGNVRETPLAVIWNSAVMRRTGELTAGDRKECAGCDYIELCRFCPGQAEVETGDPAKPYPTACRDALARSTLAGKLSEKRENQVSPDPSASGAADSSP